MTTTAQKPDPSAAQQQPAGQPRPTTEPRSTAQQIRETLESIVVAFILAFVFRAFIVEAFVIPTGSMAATLYGAQATHTCSNCGYEYAVGVSAPLPPGLVRSDSQGVLELTCPNCAWQTDRLKGAELRNPQSGDRILVHKWPFDIGGKLLGPKRWDVVVFKDPRDGTTNFIKRLIGLPGELLEIIDGDVYAAPLEILEKQEPGLIGAFDQLRKDVYELGQAGADPRRSDILPRYAELNRRLLPHLRIQRKTARAQDSLWFPVYDHDYLPSDAGSESTTKVGWQPDDEAREGWAVNQREITFESSSADPRYIEFKGKPIQDFYAYNNEAGRGRGTLEEHLVGDLRLAFTWFPDAGGGGIECRMNRDRDTFTATLAVDGIVRVVGEHPESDLPGHRQVIGEAKLPAFLPGRAVDIEFVNVDYRVSLRVDGEEVIASKPEQYAPRLAKLTWVSESALQGPLEAVVTDAAARARGSRVSRPGQQLQPSRVRIGAANLRCRFRHVALERDVYYRAQGQAESESPYDPSAPDRPRVRNPYFFRDQQGHAGWPGWGTAGCPILLRPDRQAGGDTLAGEHFMLGDNSPASKDSRLWWEIGPHLQPLGDEYQLGTVPGDQLIGKAFFVYWPAGYRLPDPVRQVIGLIPGIGPVLQNVGICPNVGRLRWIR